MKKILHYGPNRVRLFSEQRCSQAVDNKLAA